MTTGKTIALTIQIFVRKSNVSALEYTVYFCFSSKEQASFNFAAVVTIHSDFGAQKSKIWQCFHFSPICDWMLWFEFFGCWVLSQLFNSPPSHWLRGSLVPLCFLPLEWYHLCIWGCYFSGQSWFQLVIHWVLHFAWCTLIEVKSEGWQYTALSYSFPSFELVHCFMYGSNCCFLSRIQVSQKTGKMVWYSHFFKNFPVCCDPHSQRL